jgi:hypothetical protein
MLYIFKKRILSALKKFTKGDKNVHNGIAYFSTFKAF